MTDTLIILAAGASSRMKQSLQRNTGPIAHSFQSKALIPLGESRRPALDYLLDQAEEAGFQKIIIVVGEDSIDFRSYFGTKDAHNRYRCFDLSYAVQKTPTGRSKPLGTADALSQTIDQFPYLLKEQMVVCNGDNLYSYNALKTLKDAVEPNALISYNRKGLKFPTEKILTFALLIVNSAGYLKEIIEKPSPENSEKYKDPNGQLHVSMNIWKFNGTDIYPCLVNTPVHPIRNEKEIPTSALLLANLTQKGLKAYPISEHVPDLTAVEDIQEVENYLKDIK